MADDVANELIADADRLAGDKASLASTCDEIRDYIVPWQATITGKQAPGTQDRDRVVDNSGETASELFAGAIHGHLTNPGDRWFMGHIAGFEKDHEVSLWLEAVERAIFDVFDDPESNFYSDLLTSYHSTGDYGTSCMYIPARPGRVPLFQHVPFRELLIETNGEGGIGATARRWTLSAGKAAEMWPGKVGQKTMEDAGDPERRHRDVEILHWVAPRTDRDTARGDRRNMPFRSVYVNVTEKVTIDEGGFQERPYIVDRWQVRDGEVYGRGPGMKALADVRMLQRMTRAQVRGAEKTINPPLMVPDDGAFAGPIDLRSGAVNTVRSEYFQGRGGDPIRAILANARPDIAEDMLQAIRLRIDQAYYKPLILLDRDPRMTATQFIGIREQALTILGPFLGRQQNERLGPLIERAFGVLWRAGRLPEPPPQIGGAQLRFVFRSPVVRARRLADARAITEMYELMGTAGNISPEIFDNIDHDEALRIVADRVGVPKSVLRDPRVVTEMRQARMEEMQLEQQVSTFERVAPAMQSAAQAAEGMANDNNLRGAA